MLLYRTYKVSRILKDDEALTYFNGAKKWFGICKPKPFSFQDMQLTKPKKPISPD